MSDVLVVIQAVATGVSTLTAVYIVWLTISRDRELRRERERDDQHEQLRRLAEALGTLDESMSVTTGTGRDFEIARAQLAAALAIHPADLPAVEGLLSSAIQKPPYNFGEGPWDDLERAHRELLRYARSVR